MFPKFIQMSKYAYIRGAYIRGEGRVAFAMLIGLHILREYMAFVLLYMHNSCRMLFICGSIFPYYDFGKNNQILLPQGWI